MLTNLLCPFGEVRPALWFVYPDHVFLERQNGIRRAHALCACGVHGTPEELGWMGPSCDSCYDLGEEGVVPTQAWLDPKISTLFADEGRLQFLSWSPDGQTLAAGTSRDHITLWDTSTGLERGRLVGREEEWLLGVAWIDKGQRLISADARGRLCFWSAKTALPIGEPVEIGPSECFAVSDDGTICRGNRRGIQLLSSKDGSVILDPQDLLHEATTATFNADGTRFAAGNRHGQVKIYSQDGTCLASWQQEGSIVTSLAFGPNGRTLAIGLSPAPRTTGSESSGILLYDILERRVFVTLSGHANGTRCLTFAPDGRILASGGEDGIIRLWEVNGPQLGTERMALEWYLDCVSSIAFAPDGLTLAAGSFDGTIKLWPREVLRAVAVPSRSRESVGFPQMRRL
jgi:WD40 repeat protein